MGKWTAIALFFLAQTATFEVASVKRTDPSSMMGEGSARPDIRAAGGTLTMRRATLGDCVEWAYNVQGDQVSGPAWVGTERYDITAKAADQATTAELRVMLQALNRPVLDRTGLKGAYDFTLDLRGVLGPDTGDLVIAALAQQLGLRMESSKAPIDTVIIDHAEKTPAEN